MIIRLLPYISAILLLLAVFYIGYTKGETRCEIGKGKDALADVRRAGDIEKKIMGLDESNIDKRLLSWIRD